MSTYKLDFSEEHKDSIELWKYQDDELEEKYREFVTKAEEDDEDLKQDRADYLERMKQEEAPSSLPPSGDADDNFKKVDDAAPAEE